MQPTPAYQNRLNQKKILVIEDNEAIRENTAEILELANYSVVTAENGKIGLERALENKPDLIVCDIMMPELDGYGVLNVVQRNPALSNTSFIFLTAKTEGSDFRKGMGLGADDYIAKPFSGTDLLNSVESRLRKAEAIKQHIASGIEGVNELLHIASGKEALETFVEGRNFERYKKKQLIYTEGNHPIRLFYVQKGKIKVFVSNEDGKELIVGLYGEGDFFGYTALLEEIPYKDNAAVIEDAEIATIPKSEFEELMHTSRDVAKKFIKLLAKDVAEKEQQLLNIAYNSLRKKVADALVSLQDKYGAADNNFSINISRENLAAVAGTAIESLIRTLSDFKNEKLIDIKEGKISITDSNKLRRMLN
jgi:CRP-like cAMP-binding protein/AmiR/NasT family two-component response regulator